MQVVTDSGTDLCLPASEIADLNIQVLPLTITIGDRTYREGVDITPDEFFAMVAGSPRHLPLTSQPSPGDFADTYRRLAATDPNILSIHMSSGLSGTLNSAKLAAQMVPEARVTFVDTKTLAVAAGWQVLAAARALKAGQSLESALALAKRVSDASESLYTLRELKFLIHGGRINHMKGLIASMLDLKPIIGVEKTKGTYVQRGQVRSFKRALTAMVDLMEHHHPPGSRLRTQTVHSADPEGAEMLREMVNQRFDCDWLPTSQLSLALGAHVGPTMVAVGFAPLDALAGIP